MEHQIVWEGIPVTVTVEERIFNTEFDHICVKADTALSVTETGFKSYYINHETLAQFDSHEDFVIQWLDEWAKHPSWVKVREASRQLSLF